MDNAPRGKILKRDPIFYRILMSYILIAVVPTVLALAAYFFSLDSYEKAQVDSVRESLRHQVTQLEQRFFELERINDQIAMRKDVVNFLFRRSPREEGGKVYEINNLRRELAVFSNTNTFLRYYFILFNKSGVLLTPRSSFYPYRDFYGTYLQIADMDGDQWANLITDQVYQKSYIPAAPVKLLATEYENARLITEWENMVILMQTIPYEGYSENKGVVSIFIEEEKICSYLLSGVGGMDERVYILNEEGHILASNTLDSERKEIFELNVKSYEPVSIIKKNNGTKVILIRYRSLDTGWVYIKEIPYALIRQKTLNLLIILITILISVVIYIGIMSWNLSKRTSLPLQIISGISPDILPADKDDSDWTSLVNVANQLVSDEEAYSRMSEKQLPLLRKAFFNRLLNGEIGEDEELESYSREVRIDDPLDSGYVYLIYQKPKIIAEGMGAHEIRSRDVTRLTLLRHLDILCEDSGFYLEKEWNRFFVYLPVDWMGESVGDINDFEESLNLFLTDMEQLDEGSFYNYIAGGYTDSPRMFYYCYAEMIRSMDYMTLEASKKGLILEELKSGETLHFTQRMTTSLIESLNCRDKERSLDLLNEIFDRNLWTGNLSWDAQKRLRNKLVDVFRIIREGCLEEDRTLVTKLMRNIDRACTVEGLWSLMEKAVERLNLLSQARTSSRNLKLLDNIETYVRENFSDSSTYLLTVAEHFSLTDVYLSSFFKEHRGVNFSVFLEDIRLEAAKEFLKGRRKTIKEIALDSGYNSPGVFRKAFVRKYGVTPSVFRQNTKNNPFS